MNFQRFPGTSSAPLVGFLSLVSVVVVLTGVPGAYAFGKLTGNNVCTRIKSVTEVRRLPTPGRRSQTVKYTTICGMRGRCNRYRKVFVPNYREETRTAYRVVQVCCSGWVKTRGRCVIDTAATTSPPTASVSRVAATQASTSPRWRPEVGRDTTVSMDGSPNAGAGVKRTDTEEQWRQGLGASVPRTTGPSLRGKDGTDVGVKGNNNNNNRPGISGQDGAGSNRHDEGVLQDGVAPKSPADEEGFIKPATPDIHPNADSRMMFLTGMLCGGGVLSVAAFVVLFLMWRQRRGIDGRPGGIPFLQSTRFESGNFRKSKLLALAQSIRTGEVKLIKEPSKKGKEAVYFNHSDIEETPRGIRFTTSTESLPDLGKDATIETSSVSFPKMMTLQTDPTWTERGLPPEPPTYAIIQRAVPKRKAPAAPPPKGEKRPTYSRVYATPDCVPISKGDSHTIPRDFNMESARYILCESQHIYTDIQRKSKASTWSCSLKRSRPKSLASTTDAPHQESRSSRSLSRSLSRNSIRSIVAKRGSNGGSSGYNSLVSSRENVYDNYESMEGGSGPPKPNIYSETTPKEIIISAEHYDKLDLVSHDRIEYDKLSRGPTTPKAAGIVKTFSKKYEKLAASTSNR